MNNKGRPFTWRSMGIPASFMAPDSTLPSAPLPWWMWVAFILAGLFIVFEVFRYFFLSKRIIAYIKKIRSKSSMYSELSNGDQLEMDSLRNELAEKDLRVEILENLTQRVEAEKNAFKEFAREMAFEIIPQISTLDQAEKMLGTFQKFEGDSMQPIELGDDLEESIREKRDRLVDDLFGKKDKPNGSEDPE